MRKLLVISDFIEGNPVVASIRYEDLMKYINKNYYTIVVSDKKYSNNKSKYSDENYHFCTTNSVYKQNLNDTVKIKRQNIIEKLLRNKLMLYIWRSYSYSNIKFNKLNKNFYENIVEVIKQNDINTVLVTIPDIFGLYIIKEIKKQIKDITVIVEIRDIINHNIGKGNPSYVYRRAEDMIIEYADGIISLSKGITQYYTKLLESKKILIQEIKNGYDVDKFKDCKFEKINIEKKNIVFSHVGSIYKGRNVGDFIKALDLLNRKTGCSITFNIVGVLDSEAAEDIKKSINYINNSDININIIGALPNKEAIDYLKKSDIAVILTHKSGSDYAIPGKVFEYIGACKPIIAVTKDKELIELVNDKYGKCANHNYKEIYEKIIDIMHEYYDFSNRFDYSRKNQANKIMNFIEEVKIKKGR